MYLNEFTLYKRPYIYENLLVLTLILKQLQYRLKLYLKKCTLFKRKGGN